jgi:thiol-disulfide isomerase/thioredoxin
MKNMMISLLSIVIVYIAYKSVPILIYKYKRYTAHTKAINTIAPDANASTLEGKVWHMKEQQGKNIIVVFWGSYCHPCLAEIPHIQELYQKYKDNDNLEIITYSFDLSQNSEALKKFIDDKNITYPVLLEKYPQDSEKNFAKKFEVIGVPSIWFIDKNGIVLASNRRSIEEIMPFIKKYLHQ